MTSTRLAAIAALALTTACTEPGQTEIARGNVLASQKKYDEAVAAYQAAAAAAPGKARPRELLGHVYFDLQKPVEARRAYEDAVKVETGAAIEAELGLARISAAEGKVDEAMSLLARVLQRQPNNVFARLSRAHLAIQRSDFAQALEDTAVAMKVDARNASVLYTRGCAFLATGDFPQAREAFDLLEKAHPGSPLAPYGRARVAAASKQRSEVVAQLGRAKERARSVPGAWKTDEVRNDPAFSWLRDDPELTALLAN
jgi:tetratricopeptide (TPR) repeat protein